MLEQILERQLDAPLARVLADSDDHPDVEELYRRCAAVDKNISISTVGLVPQIKRFAAEGGLVMNDIANVTLNLAQPLFVDDYGNNRETGSFVLIDEATNHTVAAGMIVRSQAEGQR